MSEEIEIMFVTVGTGIDQPPCKKCGYKEDVNPAAKLAGAIALSIIDAKVNKVVFFVSEKSISTYEQILLKLKDNTRYPNENLIQSRISSIDDFDSIYMHMQKEYFKQKKAYPNATFCIDYTSGTKTMSVAPWQILVFFFFFPL